MCEIFSIFAVLPGQKYLHCYATSAWKQSLYFKTQRCLLNQELLRYVPEQSSGLQKATQGSLFDSSGSWSCPHLFTPPLLITYHLFLARPIVLSSSCWGSPGTEATLLELPKRELEYNTPVHTHTHRHTSSLTERRRGITKMTLKPSHSHTATLSRTPHTDSGGSCG